MRKTSFSSATVKARRRARGFLLIAAFSLMFAMVLIALVIANAGRHTQGFVRLVQSETLQYEAMQTEVATYLGVLCGVPDPGGMLNASPTCAYRASEGSIRLSGTALNGFTDDPAVVSLPFAGQEQQLGMPPSWRLTPQYAAMSANTALDAQPSVTVGRSYALYSRYSPFALYAGGGQVVARSVKVSSAPLQSMWADPAMASVYGRTGVALSGTLNGSAYSTTDAVSIAAGGIAYPRWAAIAPSETLTSQLAAFKGSVENGLDGELDSLLREWHQAQHEDFNVHYAAALAAEAAQCATQSAILSIPDSPFGDAEAVEATHESDVKADYDNEGGKLTVEGTLRIPGDRKHTLSFRDVDVYTLWLKGGAILHVKGNLTARSVVLATNATLIVDGTTTLQDGLFFDCDFYEANNHDLPIRTTFYGKPSLNISSRMCMTSASFQAASINGRANPYPSNLNFTCATATTPPAPVPGQVQNPANADFDIRKLAHEASAQRLKEYLGRTNRADRTGVMPPVLLMTDGRLSVRSSLCRGMLIADQDVQLEVASMAGTVWSFNGGVNAGGNDMWFYPRWQQAYPHVAEGSGSMQVGAYLPHQTAWVRRQ